MKAVACYECLQFSRTVNLVRCQQQLIRLKDEIKWKEPFTGNRTKQVILRHDNARPHAAERTKNVIYSLGREVLPRAVHSSDLVSSDYLLFQILERHLADTLFETVEQLGKRIDDHVNWQWPSFFRGGTRRVFPKDPGKL